MGEGRGGSKGREQGGRRREGRGRGRGGRGGDREEGERRVKQYQYCTTISILCSW